MLNETSASRTSMCHEDKADNIGSFPAISYITIFLVMRPENLRNQEVLIQGLLDQTLVI